MCEFGKTIDSKKINDSINIFEKSFGYKPTIFKAPCYNLNIENHNYIKKIRINNNWTRNNIFK